MIDITFPDLFKGDDLLYTRRFDIIAIQYEKKSGDNIGGSLVAIHKTAIAGQTETIPSEIHANEERSGFHRGGSRLFDVRPLALTSTTAHVLTFLLCPDPREQFMLIVKAIDILHR